MFMIFRGSKAAILCMELSPGCSRERVEHLGVLLQLRDRAGGMAIRGLRDRAIVVPHRGLLPLAALRVLSVATRCCGPRRVVDCLPGMPRPTLM